MFLCCNLNSVGQCKILGKFLVEKQVKPLSFREKCGRHHDENRDVNTQYRRPYDNFRHTDRSWVNFFYPPYRRTDFEGILWVQNNLQGTHSWHLPRSRSAQLSVLSVFGFIHKIIAGQKLRKTQPKKDNSRRIKLPIVFKFYVPPSTAARISKGFCGPKTN